jgi:hypothetical protein
MTPLGESNRRRDNEIPRSRNHWDIGHVGLGIPLGHPDGGYRTRERVQVFQLSQRQLWHSVAFKTNVCEALSVHQLLCALCEVNDFCLLKHCESSNN